MALSPVSAVVDREDGNVLLLHGGIRRIGQSQGLQVDLLTLSRRVRSPAFEREEWRKRTAQALAPVDRRGAVAAHSARRDPRQGAANRVAHCGFRAVKGGQW